MPSARSSDNSVQRSRAQTALALAPHLAMPAPSAPPARTREVTLHFWRPSVESCRCSRAMALSKITRSPDVLVVGGGNAALCAAISAREAGASALLLERAPKPHWGGNSRHTRNFRCMHACPLGQLTDAYGEDEYFSDLMQVTGGKTDEALARVVIRRSEDCYPWMEAHGVRFQPSLSGTLSLSRTNAFFLGGGMSLPEFQTGRLHRHAEFLKSPIVQIRRNPREFAQTTLTSSESHAICALNNPQPGVPWAPNRRGARGRWPRFPLPFLMAIREATRRA